MHCSLYMLHTTSSSPTKPRVIFFSVKNVLTLLVSCTTSTYITQLKYRLTNIYICFLYFLSVIVSHLIITISFTSQYLMNSLCRTLLNYLIYTSLLTFFSYIASLTVFMYSITLYSRRLAPRALLRGAAFCN